FLPLDGCERADAALPLQPHHALIQAPPEEHGAIEALQIIGRQLGLERGVDVSVAVEDRQVIDVKAGLETGSRHGPVLSRLYLLRRGGPAGRYPIAGGRGGVGGPGGGGGPGGRGPGGRAGPGGSGRSGGDGDGGRRL